MNKKDTLELLTLEFYHLGIFTGIGGVCYIIFGILTFVFNAPIKADILFMVICAVAPTANFIIAYGFTSNAKWAWILAIFEMALLTTLGLINIISLDSLYSLTGVIILYWPVSSMVNLLKNFKKHYLNDQNA